MAELLELSGQARGVGLMVGDAFEVVGAEFVVLCDAAWSAARTRDTYVATQFRGFCRRFGKKGEGKAIFAVAHTCS